AAGINGDFGREIALGDGCGDARDVAHLVGQIARHRVDALGEIAPGAGDSRYFRLATELAFGADFARHAGYLGCEGAELIDHRVVRFLPLYRFAANIYGDFAREIAGGDGCGYFGDIADLRRQVSRHRVDAVREIFPGAGDSAHLRLAPENAFGA